MPAGKRDAVIGHPALANNDPHTLQMPVLHFTYELRGEGFLTTAPAFDALRKVEALEEEKKMWKDRSESMEEMLKNIEADADEKEKEHQKLLFLIGMREGELARLHRHIDHIQEIRHLEGRDMYETRPGDLARPASPYFNEIDEQAKVSCVHFARHWIDTRVAEPVFASW